MTQQPLEYYIDRYADGTISKEEWHILKELLDQPEYAGLLDQLIDKQLLESDKEAIGWPGVTERVIQTVQAKLESERKELPVVTRRIHFLRSSWFRYAAAIILLLGAGTYLFFRNQSPKHPGREQTASAPGVFPGGNKAVLTLADGSRIVLDSAANGTLAQQGAISIVKVDSSQLAYNSGHAEPSAATGTYNIVSTPNGGQYHIILSDGTSVWLNAASSIKFPAVFSAKERQVEIKGEVYFDVTHNAKWPFIVAAEGMNIQVLGTSFNVNAYPDEAAVKTTLLKGSVRVVNMQRGNAAGQTALLKPGEQAILAHDLPGTQAATGFTIDKDADVEEAIAWKNGYFYFKHADLQTVLRQLARWYDMTIEYQGPIPDTKFGGDIPRNASAGDVLKILAKTKLRFTIEGKKIIIQP